MQQCSCPMSPENPGGVKILTSQRDPEGNTAPRQKADGRGNRRSWGEPWTAEAGAIARRRTGVVVVGACG